MDQVHTQSWRVDGGDSEELCLSGRYRSDERSRRKIETECGVDEAGDVGLRGEAEVGGSDIVEPAFVAISTFKGRSSRCDLS